VAFEREIGIPRINLMQKESKFFPSQTHRGFLVPIGFVDIAKLIIKCITRAWFPFVLHYLAVVLAFIWKVKVIVSFFLIKMEWMEKFYLNVGSISIDGEICFK